MKRIMLRLVTFAFVRICCDYDSLFCLCCYFILILQESWEDEEEENKANDTEEKPPSEPLKTKPKKRSMQEIIAEKEVNLV